MGQACLCLTEILINSGVTGPGKHCSEVISSGENVKSALSITLKNDSLKMDLP